MKASPTIPSRSRSRYVGVVSSGNTSTSYGPSRLIGDVEMDEFAAIMPEDDEDEEKAEGEGGNEREVDRDDVSDMSGEKGAPRGRRPRRGSAHVFGDGQFGDVAEEGEFCADAPPAPGGILASHASDVAANLGVQPVTDHEEYGAFPGIRHERASMRFRQAQADW
jgi:hypothetical protein